jgi:hypothetical protein
MPKFTEYSFEEERRGVYTINAIDMLRTYMIVQLFSPHRISLFLEPCEVEAHIKT